MLCFKDWFLFENTISQIVKTDPQIQQVISTLQLPAGFQALSQADQINLKKWLAYQLVKKDPQIMSKIGAMHVILDPNDRFQVRKKLNKLDYDFNALSKDNDAYHKSLQSTQQRVYSEPVRALENMPYINGLRWVSLDKDYCDKYGKSMGHCGNVARKEGDNILSLMDNKNQHYLTFIVNNHVLGEMKGQHNQKPAQKFHPNIIQLLLSPYVDVVKGLGYKPENNFQLSDLTPQEQQKVLSAKPNIDNYVGHVNEFNKAKWGSQPRDWFREDSHYLFNRNMSDFNFDFLAKGLVDPDEIDPVGEVSIAAEYMRRKMSIPAKLYSAILCSPEASYLYAVNYLDTNKLPADILQSISHSTEYSASLAAEVMKGKNVPEVLMNTIMNHRGGLSSYIYFLIEHGYEVEPDIWSALKGNFSINRHGETVGNYEVETLFKYDWTNGIPEKLYDYVSPDLALYLIATNNDKWTEDKRIIDLAHKADLSYIEDVVKGTRLLPPSILKIVIEKSMHSNAVYQALKRLLHHKEYAEQFDKLDWIKRGVEVVSWSSHYSYELVQKLKHLSKTFGFEIPVPDSLYKSISTSDFLNDFILEAIRSKWTFPEYLWKDLNARAAAHLISDLGSYGLSDEVEKQVKYLKNKFNI